MSDTIILVITLCVLVAAMALVPLGLVALPAFLLFTAAARATRVSQVTARRGVVALTTTLATSYAVAEAVCVPLTGWLAGRFGTVRTFTFGMIGFGIFSVLCGLSTSLGMLVACRIGQGLCGGPLMPLSQTLLMRIFKPEQRAQAMGVWAMTTVTAPILGPILGGTISDSWS